MPPERITVKLIPKATVAMRATASREDLNQTDVVNRALQVYDYLRGVVEDGGQLMILRRDGETEAVRFL